MIKRLFVALPLSEKFQAEIAAWEKNFSQLPVRWTAGRNLHITLIAPWEEAEEHIPEVIRILKDFKNQPALKNFPKISEIDFQKVKFGPTPLTPRLIWAEGETPAEMFELKKALGRVLDLPDHRPFSPHITLARFRPEEFNGFSVKNLDESVGWTETFSNFVLMESRLSPAGADYQVLERFNF
jgi:2'-5' RNA ligase